MKSKLKSNGFLYHLASFENKKYLKIIQILIKKIV